MALTVFEKALQRQLRFDMGAPVVLIENDSDAAMWENPFTVSKRWLRKFYTQCGYSLINIPVDRRIKLTDIHADIAKVADVIQESSGFLSTTGLNNFFDDLPLGAGSVGINTIDYTMYVQILADRELRNRIYSMDADYFISNGYLNLTPKGGVASVAFIKYTLKTVVSENVESPWDDYYYQRLLIALKVHIGRYRSKFKIISTPSGDIESDGDKLLDEAKTDLKDLETDIRENRPADNIFQG